MKPSRAFSSGFRVIVLVVISSSFSWGQQLQCQTETVTVFRNGTADFGSLPAGAQDIVPVHDPGPIGGWYDLAGKFVDAVRPGNLPYGVSI